MRPIDADELKARIPTIEDEYKYVHKLIDNTPTLPLPDFKEGYKQAIIDGKTNFSRPKGEWKEWTDERWGGTTIYCPYCKEKALEKYSDGLHRQIKSHFCPNCGVDMRGEKNDK